LDLISSAEDKEFRERARDWLNETAPRERRPHHGEAMREYDKNWQKVQFDEGWAGVSWPVEYGGLGLGLSH